MRVDTFHVHLTLKGYWLMYTTMILSAIAGLSLFLYGMQLMGDGLQK